MKVIIVFYSILVILLTIIGIEYNLLYLFSIVITLSTIICLKEIIITKLKYRLEYDKVPKYELWNEMNIEDINPIYAGILTKKEKININNIIAVLFDLEAKNVVKINVIGEEYYIELNLKSSRTGLNFYEYKILQLFFCDEKHTNTINLKEKLKEFKNDYKYKILLKELYNQMEQDAKKRYFTNIMNSIKNNWYNRLPPVVAIFGWVWVALSFKSIGNFGYINLLLYIVLIGSIIFIQSSKVIKKEYYEKVNKVYGLCRYLEEYSLISSKEIKYVKLYEKFYIFAVSLGIATEFKKEFRQKIVDNNIVFYIQLIFSKNNVKRRMSENYLLWWFLMTSGLLMPTIAGFSQQETEGIIAAIICIIILVVSFIGVVTKIIRDKINQKYLRAREKIYELL